MNGAMAWPVNAIIIINNKKNIETTGVEPFCLPILWCVLGSRRALHPHPEGAGCSARLKGAGCSARLKSRVWRRAILKALRLCAASTSSGNGNGSTSSGNGNGSTSSDNGNDSLCGAPWY